MSELTLVSFLSPTEIAEAHVLQRARMQGLVREARANALRDPNQWLEALHNLTPSQEGEVIAATMHGEHSLAGHLLREALQMHVLDAATDRAKDRVFERFGVDMTEPV